MKAFFDQNALLVVVYLHCCCDRDRISRGRAWEHVRDLQALLATPDSHGVHPTELSIPAKAGEAVPTRSHFTSHISTHPMETCSLLVNMSLIDSL
jgi:hypothetical protein